VSLLGATFHTHLVQAQLTAGGHHGERLVQRRRGGAHAAEHADGTLQLLPPPADRMRSRQKGGRKKKALLTATSLQVQLRGLISSSTTYVEQHLSNPRDQKNSGFAASHMTSLRKTLEGASRANPSTACDNPPALLPSLQNW
jgi:hypothetical protein